jgi:hypothetical protein
MSKKKPEEASNHDECVLAIAQELKKDKWEVNANLPGWGKPAQVGPYVPDVQAKKPGCLTRICQVATEDMFKGNRDEYLELTNYCAEYDFHFYVVKDGKQVEINPADLAKKKP